MKYIIKGAKELIKIIITATLTFIILNILIYLRPFFSISGD